MESKSHKVKLDIEELEKLFSQANRKGVQDILTIHISKLKTQLLAIKDEDQEGSTKTIPKETDGTPKSYVVTIRNYSWDESDKFMKLYVSLKNVQSLDKEKITSKFTENGLTLNVFGLDGKDHILNINRLAGAVNIDSSYHKVKTDMIAVMISKATPGKWEAVTFEEKKTKDARKPNMDKNDNKDPSGGIMNLMKQMYDDGDDNMKRMMNKSWYESQQKQGMGGLPGGMGGMGGLPGGMGGMGGLPGGMGGMGGLPGGMGDMGLDDM